ncbi:MAG: response regulator [Ilumatobacter fluminis]|uniref:Two-component system chemotaxis response regulator CheY n=1 Tax=Ilumatobacter fluminis TaxID=467091 RepID=A0A4V3EJE2_9ACTN|nr:response regulator [Ilumatobacter fluminis]TDT18058.1 two-component system chemotaxis response regulator CheY [Ilumatobacter fluminis]
MARILIVDDDMVSRVLLRHLLAAHGHEVVEADDGTTAADTYRPGDVDLIISDQEMPTMSGIELRRHLGEGLTVPFVLLTGYATGDEFALSPEADEVDAFLTKPVSAAMVDQLLANLEL